MTTRDPAIDLERRELVLTGVLLAAIARLVGPPEAFLVVALLPVAMVVAGMAVLRTDERPGRPYASLIIPAVLVGGAGASLHLVPIGLGLLPAVLALAIVLDLVLALEIRLLLQATGTTDSDRHKLMAAAVVTAFVAFTGIAALVPGGLPEPDAAAATAAGTSAALTSQWLLVLGLGDALVALALGFRIASVRYGGTGDAIRSALTYAIVVAVAAGAIRAMAVPRLVGPAALTLVFYLWDALHATAPARRREPRFLWETLLLAALAIVVIAWNANLPG